MTFKINFGDFFISKLFVWFIGENRMSVNTRIIWRYKRVTPLVLSPVIYHIYCQYGLSYHPSHLVYLPGFQRPQKPQRISVTYGHMSYKLWKKYTFGFEPRTFEVEISNACTGLRKSLFIWYKPAVASYRSKLLKI